jgi:tRNA (cytidine/uridine-2'-O-)-methyltransferase
LTSEYNSWEDFLSQRKPSRDRLYFFEEHGAQSLYEPDYEQDAYLVFGCESAGLPPAILDSMDDRVFHLPMLDKRVRSLNLANVATAVIYQAMRTQLGG